MRVVRLDTLDGLRGARGLAQGTDRAKADLLDQFVTSKTFRTFVRARDRIRNARGKDRIRETQARELLNTWDQLNQRFSELEARPVNTEGALEAFRADLDALRRQMQQFNSQVDGTLGAETHWVRWVLVGSVGVAAAAGAWWVVRRGRQR